ncbi:glucose/galactose MFS transporter [Marinobacterium zhoushanense]|uniref:Glucose/galactose MFS transporter n=1 Tax=Marinobacterium zhoushanense TaxID=1679163 RepID=A0ABQ1K4C7_9GAMM|nr:L-fucose:H+ symporter permease [Marinobacterium zhoushanense]GGB82912.1 glucose/galactose MFS transporter [Marinobacterium zhoushanense]
MAKITDSAGMARVEHDSTARQSSYSFALSALTSLFFIWGFITCLNDILIPHLKNVFSLNYTQAVLIQFCFFGAYFIVSLPAGSLVKRIGYKGGIIVGLLLCAAGCLLFLPAATLRLYPLFLLALFVLASGVTLLQVSANPYVTVLGNPTTASSRLTLTQAFNALGTTIAPLFGALLILSAASASLDTLSAAELDAFRQHESEAVRLPYLLLACVFLLLAAIFAALKLPTITHHEPDATTDEESCSAWQHSHLVLGAIGIFAYVGAEVSIGSFLISFLGEEQVAGLAESNAAHYVTYYWGGAMVGRFVGAVLMRRYRPGHLLAFNACAAILLLLSAVFSQGALAMWSVLAVGLCNSIMFPTIFGLALHRLGTHTSQGAGILCLAIVGGAVLPLLQGILADTVGVQLSYLLPPLYYAYIAFYGIKGSIPKTEMRVYQPTNR